MTHSKGLRIALHLEIQVCETKSVRFSITLCLCNPHFLYRFQRDSLLSIQQAVSVTFNVVVKRNEVKFQVVVVFSLREERIIMSAYSPI